MIFSKLYLYKFLVEYLISIIFFYVVISDGTAIAIGSAQALAIFVGRIISTGDVYYNPAATVMMTVAGKLPLYDLLPYIVCQVSGSLTALGIYKYIKL